MTTLIAFFIAEIGGKTQIATMALAAAYANLAMVVRRHDLGMLAPMCRWCSWARRFRTACPSGRSIRRGAAVCGFWA